MGVLEDFLVEWFTGRDAAGNESARFRQRWASVGGFRSYTPRTEDIHPDAALSARLGITGMNVRIALAIDGDYDVRIELERASGREVLRWRPDGGLGDHVVHRGEAVHTHRARFVPVRRDASEALALDHEDDDVTHEDTAEAISALKRRRLDLIDQIEVGMQGAADEMSAIDTKLAAIRVRHDELHIARKAVAYAKGRDDLAARIASEPESAEVAALRPQLDALTAVADRFANRAAEAEVARANRINNREAPRG